MENQLNPHQILSNARTKTVYKVVYNERGKYVSVSRSFNRFERICDELMLEYEIGIPVVPKRNVIFAFDTLANAAYFCYNIRGTYMFASDGLEILKCTGLHTEMGKMVITKLLTSPEEYNKGLLREENETIYAPTGTVKCLWIEPLELIDKTKYAVKSNNLWRLKSKYMWKEEF